MFREKAGKNHRLYMNQLATSFVVFFHVDYGTWYTVKLVFFFAGEDHALRGLGRFRKQIAEKLIPCSTWKI